MAASVQGRQRKRDREMDRRRGGRKGDRMRDRMRPHPGMHGRMSRHLMNEDNDLDAEYMDVSCIGFSIIEEACVAATPQPEQKTNLFSFMFIILDLKGYRRNRWAAVPPKVC